MNKTLFTIMLVVVLVFVPGGIFIAYFLHKKDSIPTPEKTSDGNSYDETTPYSDGSNDYNSGEGYDISSDSNLA